MINRDKLRRDIRVVAQEAWTNDANTTLNKMVEYICIGASERIVDALEAELKEFKDEIRSLQESQGDETPKSEVKQTRTPKAKTGI